MGTKAGTSTSQVQIPKEVLARYTAANTAASNAASTPFQTYSTDPSQFVAQFNPTEQTALSGIQGAYGNSAPMYGQAAAATQAGMGQANPGELDVQKYMNPYLNTAVNSTEQVMNQMNQQAMSGQTGNAISQGAFGGDRAGIAAAVLAGQQQMASGNVIAGMENQGYNTALGAAQQQQGLSLAAQQANLARQMAGGQQLAGIGAQEFQNQLAGNSAAMQAGQIQQQTDQAGKSALYNQWLQQQAYPFQTAQFLANIAEGIGAQSGSTTTTTYPMPFFSDRRLKTDIHRIGETDKGLPIYKFRYKADPTKRVYTGLMADDVEKVHPEAVGLAGGYKVVDYDRATRATGGLVGYADGGAPEEYGGGPTPDQISLLKAKMGNFNPNGGFYGRGLGAIGAGGYVPAPQEGLVARGFHPAPSPSAQQQSGWQAIHQAALTGQDIADTYKSGSAMWDRLKSMYAPSTPPNMKRGGVAGYAFGGDTEPYDATGYANPMSDPATKFLPKVGSYVPSGMSDNQKNKSNSPPPPPTPGLGGSSMSNIAGAAGAANSLYGLGSWLLPLLFKDGGSVPRQGFDDGGAALPSWLRYIVGPNVTDPTDSWTPQQPTDSPPPRPTYSGPHPRRGFDDGGAPVDDTTVPAPDAVDPNDHSRHSFVDNLIQNIGAKMGLAEPGNPDDIRRAAYAADQTAPAPPVNTAPADVPAAGNPRARWAATLDANRDAAAAPSTATAGLAPAANTYPAYTGPRAPTGLAAAPSTDVATPVPPPGGVAPPAPSVAPSQQDNLPPPPRTGGLAPAQQEASPGLRMAQDLIRQSEGAGINPNDHTGSQAGTRFGFNSDQYGKPLNAVTQQDVSNQITKWYNENGGPQIEAKYGPRFAAAYINLSMLGQGRAAQTLKQAGSDPNKFFDLMGQKLSSLGGPNVKGWMNRVNQQKQVAMADGPVPVMAGDIPDSSTPIGGGLAPRTTRGPMSQVSAGLGGVGDWMKNNSNILLPVLSGLGTMASSNSPFLGGAILQGLGGGAKSYMDWQQQQAGIDATKANTVKIANDALAAGIIEMKNGMTFINTDQGLKPIFSTTSNDTINGSKELAQIVAHSASILSKGQPASGQSNTPPPPQTAPTGLEGSPANGSVAPSPTIAPEAVKAATPPAPSAANPSPGVGSLPEPAAAPPPPSNVRFDMTPDQINAKEMGTIGATGVGLPQAKALSDEIMQNALTGNQAATATKNNTSTMVKALSDFNAANNGGPLTGGFAGEMRQQWGSMLDTAMRATGNPGLAGVPAAQVMDKVSTWLSTTRMSEADQKSYSALAKGVSASPNVNQNPRAAAEVAANVWTSQMQDMDKYRFMNAYRDRNQFKTVTGAPDEFNSEKAYPTEKYTIERNILTDLISPKPNDPNREAKRQFLNMAMTNPDPQKMNQLLQSWYGPYLPKGASVPTDMYRYFQ